MGAQLEVKLGQATDKGRKKINQDFFGSHIPKQPLLHSKGIAVCLADGISSSEVSQYAAEASVKSFLEDYYSTPDSWSVKTSAQRVIKATNSWLYSQTRNSQYRFSPDRGYVCTFSALIIKSNTAHIFHAGDTRVYRLNSGQLEQLTEDHRLHVSAEKSYLRRALGMKDTLQIDYLSLSIEENDVFIMATDGIYEFIDDKTIINIISRNNDNLEESASCILHQAYENGSDDNMSLSVVRVEQLPKLDANETLRQLQYLPFPPELKARMQFDGYQIVREIHVSSRSYIYLAVDEQTKQQVVIKVPSLDQRENPEYLERFLLEEWVAKRLNNAHVLKPVQQQRKQNYLYTVMEYLQGKTLKQWMIDNPTPDIETVRKIVEQIAIGLRAFHRQEMLHQDLRPDNIMIDETGTVKIIDFGSTLVAGLAETNTVTPDNAILGTVQYSAPEYFLGEGGTSRSDMFSLGVITYHMLSGRLPYGAQVSRATSRAAQRRLRYQSVLDDERTIPAYVDAAIRKAVQIDPNSRYEEITEFVYDLRHPNKSFLNKSQAPLLERNPVLFWKMISLFLSLIILFLLGRDKINL